MSDIAIGQLCILAEELSDVNEKLESLKERQEELRSLAFDLLLETNEKSIKTDHGTFTKNNGKTTKIITCPKYKKAKKELEELMALAITNKKYKEKKGKDYLTFRS